MNHTQNTNVDWAHLLLSADLDIPIGKSEFSIVCPFHDDSVASCSINVDKGVWICFAGCGQGSLAKFLQRLLNISDSEVNELVYKNEYSLNLDFFEDVEPTEEFMPEVELPSEVIAGTYPAWVYQRDFKKVTLESWGCRTNNHGDLIIPIHDIDSKLVGWVSRRPFLVPKYLYSKGLKKSKVLFGGNKIDSCRFVCVTEGTLDAMWLTQNGYPAVAILGMDMSKAQQKLLTSLPTQEIVLCLDNDEAGTIGFNKAFSALTQSIITTFIKIPKEYKDVQDIREKKTLDRIIADRYYW